MKVVLVLQLFFHEVLQSISPLRRCSIWINIEVFGGLQERFFGGCGKVTNLRVKAEKAARQKTKGNKKKK